MSPLATYSQKRFPALAVATIDRISAGTLYYLIRGRNAWHATWVTHYRDGSLSASLAVARQVAEQWRAQGSVFTIREQPALVCHTNTGTFALTEINTDRPLGNLTRRRGAEMALSEIQRRLSSKEPKTTVEQLASLVSAAAKYSWSPLCPPKSLAMVASSSVLDIDRLRTRNLKAWDSTSLGGDYYLSWSERASTITPGAILRIARTANEAGSANGPVDGS